MLDLGLRVGVYSSATLGDRRAPRRRARVTSRASATLLRAEPGTVRFTVYALLDPTTGEPRYVGYTGHACVYRLRKHMEKATERKSNIQRWLWQLKSSGHGPPRIRVLGMCSVPRAVGKRLGRMPRAPRWCARSNAAGCTT